MALTIASTIPLANGVQMPRLGLGTWRLAPGEETRRVVREALGIGYRLIDTASAYGNEADVGNALAESGIPREQVFVTTKVWVDEQGYVETVGACQQSLMRLRLDYVDLYLIHWPAPHRWPMAWKAMQTLMEDGLCCAIGVSNFDQHHLEQLRALSSVTPAVDQVEFNPFLFKRDLLAYCQGAGIVLQSYSPLTRGAKLGHPTLQGVAERHGKTPAQVVLRWALQHGVSVIPKAASPAHLRENAEIFDFALAAEDMAALDGLDEGYSIISPEWKSRFA